MTRAGLELRTQRLRSFRSRDELALYRLWNDPHVGRYLWDGRPVPRETVVEQIALSQRSFETRGYGQFALALDADPATLIGFCGLRPFGEPERVELLYALHPAFWGRGLASEAARAVLRHGFETAGLEETHAGADPPSLASFRVMERLGMSFAGEWIVGGRPARYHRQLRGPRRAPRT